MRRFSLPVFALAIGAALFLSSCMARTPDTVRTEPQSEREQKIESLLKEYEQGIKELNARAAEATGTLREELGKSLEDLKRKHQEAAKKLENLREATNTAWKDVNAQLQITLEELKKTFDKAREQAK